MKNSDYPLCDYKCPLHESCANYFDEFDKGDVDHWGKEPYNYKKESCYWYVPLTDEDIIERIQRLIKPSK